MLFFGPLCDVRYFPGPRVVPCTSSTELVHVAYLAYEVSDPVRDHGADYWVGYMIVGKRSPKKNKFSLADFLIACRMHLRHV